MNEHAKQLPEFNNIQQSFYTGKSQYSRKLLVWTTHFPIKSNKTKKRELKNSNKYIKPPKKADDQINTKKSRKC